MRRDDLSGAQTSPARNDFRVALVYPPYGPAGLPNLGLALLSAGVKKLGFDCRTFYWNLSFAAAMPGEGLKERLRVYHELTGRNLMPFSEWVFARLVHDDRLADREAGLERRMNEIAFGASSQLRFKSEILALRERAGGLVASLVDQLEPYALIGVNTTFYQNLPALALARAVKARWPEKTVVLGGANCDGEMGAALLRQFPFVSHIFSGEVDNSFPEYVRRLASGQPLDGVDGLQRRNADGAPFAAPPAPPLADLNALPLPDFDDYVAERRRIGLDEIHDVVLALESSRGCWWGERQHCTFCGLNANGMAYRHKDVERFQSEVETIANRYDARYIFMTDNIMATKYYDSFAVWAAKAGIRADFFYEIKANVRRRHVARLAEARISSVQPGIESFSSKILSLMRKGATAIQNIALLKYAREFGVYLAYNILVGFPGEDEGEYARLALVLPSLFHLQPPTGLPAVEFHRFSPYHQRPDEFGIRLRPSAMYDELYPFPQQDIAQLAYIFEREDAPEERAYLAGFCRQIERWRRQYRERDCTLTFRREGADILVNDRRREPGGQSYRLAAFAAELFLLSEEPRPLSGLAEAACKSGSPTQEAEAFVRALFGAEPGEGEIRIDFSAESFRADPDACLRPLVEAGLLYVEDGKCLALPVTESFQPSSGRWRETGV